MFELIVKFDGKSRLVLETVIIWEKLVFIDIGIFQKNI